MEVVVPMLIVFAVGLLGILALLAWIDRIDPTAEDRRKWVHDSRVRESERTRKLLEAVPSDPAKFSLPPLPLDVRPGPRPPGPLKTEVDD